MRREFVSSDCDGVIVTGSDERRMDILNEENFKNEEGSERRPKTTRFSGTEYLRKII